MKNHHKIPSAAVTSYEEYLQSEWWGIRRALAIERGGRKCAKCSATKRLHVHHLSYERTWREEDSDLMVLCENCHSKIHRKDYGDAQFGDEVILQKIIRPRLPRTYLKRLQAWEIIPLLRKGKQFAIIVYISKWSKMLQSVKESEKKH